MRATPISAHSNAADRIRSRATRSRFAYRVLILEKRGVDMWKSLKVGVALSGVLFLGLTACNQSPPASHAPKGPSPASQAWNKLTAGFIQSYPNARPAVVDRDLFWMEKAKFPPNNPAWYKDTIDPDVYLNRDYAPLNVRMKAYIKYARGIPKMANDIKTNLQSPLPKTSVEFGIALFGGLADFYTKGVAPVFASGSDPDLQKRLTEADAAAAQAMDALKRTMEEDLNKENDKFALGPDLYAQMVLETEGVSAHVDQIEAAGLPDLARTTEG